MPSDHRHLRSAGLRVVGLALLAFAGFAASSLYRMACLGGAHEATPAEMAVAAVAVLGASAGAVLLALGAHIFDQVDISARWAPRNRSGR